MKDLLRQIKEKEEEMWVLIVSAWQQLRGIA